VNEIVFHSLRNSYFSFFANSQKPATVIQKLARHSDPNLTFNVYARVLPEAEQKAVTFLPDFGHFYFGNHLAKSLHITGDQSLQGVITNSDNDNKNAVLTNNQIAPRGFEPLLPG
jgi:hypothetical protein